MEEESGSVCLQRGYGLGPYGNIAAMTKVTISSESEVLILTAAENVFRTKGYKQGTVRDIAKHSGMSVGSVASLGPKEQLLIRVMECKIGDAQQSQDLSLQADEGSPGEAIIRQLNGFFDLFEREWPLAREYAAVLATGRFESAVFPGLVEDLVNDFCNLIRARGSTSVRDRAPGVAWSIYLAYLGSLYLWTAQGVELRSTCQKHLANTIRLLLE